MKPDETNNEDMETLEHLLGVIVENREQRCTQVRDDAKATVADILKQAHRRVRARMHRHVIKLREKYKDRITATRAHHQTLIRQQHQATDKALLEKAWPMLRESINELWCDESSRKSWMKRALASASGALLGDNWRVEHPIDLDEKDKQWLLAQLKQQTGVKAELLACEDIGAGIRVIAQTTVFDATLGGLLHQREKIESLLIGRIKQALK